MKIGDLRHRVQLQAASDYQDDLGQAQRVWATYATVWAQVSEAGGVENLAGAQLNATLSHSILIRYRDDVQSNHRLLYKGRELNISRPPRDPDGTKVALIIDAIENTSMAGGAPG